MYHKPDSDVNANITRFYFITASRMQRRALPSLYLYARNEIPSLSAAS